MSMRAAVFVAIVAVLLLVAVGMHAVRGGDESGEATTVTLAYAADSDAKPSEMSCPGETEAANAACTQLQSVPAEIFDPVAEDAMCTMIYGGPETFHVKGRVNSRDVDARFNRANGCEIERWEQIEPVIDAMDLK